jgi:hypothetical protein
VVEPGVTDTEAPVKAPGFHVYDTAPTALSVDDAPDPEQIAVGELVAVIVGFALTIKLTVFELAQAPLDPVTV